MKIKRREQKRFRCTFQPLAVMFRSTAILITVFYSTETIRTFPTALAFLVTTRVSRQNIRQSELFSEQTTYLEPFIESKDIAPKRQSQISYIRCENFAGMTNGRQRDSIGQENVIMLDFDKTTKEKFQDEVNVTNMNKTSVLEGNLVCITGETGSGKSLLVSKVADLLTGGKANISLLRRARQSTSVEERNSEGDGKDPQTNLFSAASVEMKLLLHDEAHTTHVSNSLRRMGLDPTNILEQLDDGIPLRLKRIISATPKSMNSDKKDSSNTEKTAQQRLKSTCYINDHLVPLKVLKEIASPLIAVVNAPVAASALGRPASRLSMIDCGVPTTILARVHKLQTVYRKCKQKRESLESELEKQVLPASMVPRGIGIDSKDGPSPFSNDNEEHLELVQHWIEELDGFERRMSDLQNSLCSDAETLMNRVSDEELEVLLNNLNAMNWTSEDTSTSSLYEQLLDLHDYLKSLDERIALATEARESLASLSAPDSVRVALDRTRQLLVDAAPQQHRGKGDIISDPSSKSQTSTRDQVSFATEQAHEMLNMVEDALMESAKFFDDEKGLLATLRTSRRMCSKSTEELFEYITEWNTLARKHGVSSHQLPSCHVSLKKELQGGFEAKKLLPEAKIAEREALKELKEACGVLSEARSKLCGRISDSISSRLPRLGMENSKFEARLSPIDTPTYSHSSIGANKVDFYLLHENSAKSNKYPDDNGDKSRKQRIGGTIESVASSGEKARLLLAVECEIPGSISATSREHLVLFGQDYQQQLSPVVVIYDEIDAHVGGRASVSVAQMLFDQSKACQVLSIT